MGAGGGINTGTRNTCIGDDAGTLITTATRSIAIGHAAMATTAVTGAANIAIGNATGNAMLAGTQNVMIGESAGKRISTGDNNTFVGQLVGEGVVGADNNTAMGNNALRAAAGDANTAIGVNAGVAITGASNVCIGENAGFGITGGSDNVCIGANAGRNQLATNDDELYIARAAVAPGNDGCWIHGTATGACVNGDNSTAWAQTSDERIKKNIADSSVGLSAINQVQVRNFEYRTFDELDDNVKALNEGKGLNVISKLGTKTGVIAQEIEAIFPRDVQDLPDGTKIVTPSDLNYALIKAVQELSTALDAALARITTLEG